MPGIKLLPKAELARSWDRSSNNALSSPFGHDVDSKAAFVAAVRPPFGLHLAHCAHRIYLARRLFLQFRQMRLMATRGHRH